MEAHGDLDERGTNIFAAATTLRDFTGRDRLHALRSMCRQWGVDRREKIDGKWKNRGMAALETLLSESVCMAAARWQAQKHGPRERRGVPEQAVSETAQTLTLEDVINKLSAQSDLDELGKDILAAAITLRDSTGRDRKAALHSMCRAWSVDRREKIDGKWKNRGMAVLETLLSEAVCMAAARWQSNRHGQMEQRGVPEHAALETAQYDASSVGEEVKERGVAEHPTASSSSTAPPEAGGGAGRADQRVHARDDTSPSHTVPAKKPRVGTAEPMQAADSTAPSSAGTEPRILPLAITQDGVMSLRRLGPDLFEATKRSGEVWMGDTVLLETLPQGRARLATLTVTEIMRGRSAKPKPEEDGMNPTSVASRSTEPR